MDIVSQRLHWIRDDNGIKSKIIERAKNGTSVNIYLPETNEISEELKQNNIKIHISPALSNSLHPRFTLVDKNRLGATKLDVGTGTVPNFTISEFDESTNAQIISLARNYVELLESTNP